MPDGTPLYDDRHQETGEQCAYPRFIGKPCYVCGGVIRQGDKRVIHIVWTDLCLHGDDVLRGMHARCEARLTPGDFGIEVVTDAD
jgi:hypothetical protein